MDIEDLNMSCGFGRVMDANLHATVGHYLRHLFICTGRADWPNGISKEGTYGKLCRVIKDCNPTFSKKVLVNASNQHSKAPSDASFDLLLFPEMIRLEGVGSENIDALVEALRQETFPDSSSKLTYTHLDHSSLYIFVCTHAAVDKRCGYCGPPLVEALQLHFAQHSDGERVVVGRTSHVGGHKYAGNMILYPGGDWYGYVKPDRVIEIAEAHLKSPSNPEIIRELWRGRMGMTQEEQLAFLADRT